MVLNRQEQNRYPQEVALAFTRQSEAIITFTAIVNFEKEDNCPGFERLKQIPGRFILIFA